MKKNVFIKASIIIATILCTFGDSKISQSSYSLTKEDMNYVSNKLSEYTQNVLNDIDSYVDINYCLEISKNYNRKAKNSYDNENQKLSNDDKIIDYLSTVTKEKIDELENDEIQYLYMIANENETVSSLFSMYNIDVPTVDIPQQEVNQENELKDIDKKEKKFEKNISKKSLCSAATLSFAMFGLSMAEATAVEGTLVAEASIASAWYIPSKVKIVLITALVISSIVIFAVIWNKIKNDISRFVNVCTQFLINRLSSNPIVKTIVELITGTFATVSATAASNELNDALGKHSGEKGIGNISQEGAKKVIETMIGLTLVELMRKNKPVVFLGRSSGQYYLAAINQGGIAYHTNDTNWNRFVKEFTYEGLWIINEVYLDLVISLDCSFVLVDTPYDYYHRSTHWVKKENGYEVMYGKEMKYIHTTYNYYWANEMGTFVWADK